MGFPEGNSIESITGLRRGHYSGRTVLVRGKGPSGAASIDGALVLAVNPTPDSPQDYHIAIATDSEWWNEPRNMIAVDGRETIVPMHSGRNVMPPDSEWLHKASLPEVYIGGAKYSQVQITDESGHIRSAMGGAFLAVMAGLYLTDGNVVVAGCDLSTQHYIDRHSEKWTHCCREWKKTGRVFAHKKNAGIVKTMLPIYLGEPSDVFIVVGSGPSAGAWQEFRELQPRIIACNGAIVDVPNPDIYLASDKDAVTRYGNAAKNAEKNGTMVLLNGSVQAGLPPINSRIRTITIHALRHALVCNPARVILCGLDGWDESEYRYVRLNGQKSNREGSNENQAWHIYMLKKQHPRTSIEFARPCVVEQIVKTYEVSEND